MEMRIDFFDRHDWMAFAGAESFENGGNPVIATGSKDGIDWTVIVDREGIEVTRIDTTKEDFPMRTFSGRVRFASNTIASEFLRDWFNHFRFDRDGLVDSCPIVLSTH